jgi:PAS domain S-box-containing protein
MRTFTPPSVPAPDAAAVRARARRGRVPEPPPAPEGQGSLLPFFGIGALFLLVVVALHLSARLKGTLEDELAGRLRVSAEMSASLLSEAGEDAVRPGEEGVLGRLEEIRAATSVSEIVLYGRDGALIAAATSNGVSAGVPRKIRVANAANPADAGLRAPERDAAGGLSLVVPLAADAGAGALLTRIDRERQGGLAAADFLFQIAKVLAGVVTASGLLILLRWIARGGPEPPPRSGPGLPPASDVDLVLGTMKEVMSTLKDSEVESRDRMTAAEADADLTRRTNDLIVDSIGSGLVAFDRNGRVTMFNRAAEGIFGFARRAALGRPVDEVFGREERIALLALDLLDRERPARRVEYSTPGPEGDTRWLGVSSSVLRDADGIAAGGILLVADLTETRRLRDAAELKDRLSAVGEMSAGIAHEIKNALHSLLGYANLLKEDHPGDEPPLAVTGILEDVRSIEALVKDVLEFGKPSQLVKEPTDVGALLKQAADSARAGAGGSAVDVRLEIEEALPPAPVDGEAVRRVFLNLALNAVQAMGAAGGTLTIGARSAEMSDEREPGEDGPSLAAIRVSFRDTGPGIPEEERRKIFTPFWTTKRDGNGLGLALAHKTVTDHGGRVTLHSRVGVGTEFVLMLPAEEGTG